MRTGQFRAISAFLLVAGCAYASASPTGPSVVFESEGVAGEPRFRLSYEGAVGGRLVIVFSIAPPGEDFRVYTSGTARRK